MVGEGARYHGLPPGRCKSRRRTCARAAGTLCLISAGNLSRRVRCSDNDRCTSRAGAARNAGYRARTASAMRLTRQQGQSPECRPSAACARSYCDAKMLPAVILPSIGRRFARASSRARLQPAEAAAADRHGIGIIAGQLDQAVVAGALQADDAIELTMWLRWTRTKRLVSSRDSTSPMASGQNSFRVPSKM